MGEKDLHDEKGPHGREIVLNQDGFPLVPQPSTRKDDPLVSAIAPLIVGSY